MKKAAAARGLNVSEPKPTDPDALRRWKNRQQTHGRGLISTLLLQFKAAHSVQVLRKFLILLFKLTNPILIAADRCHQQAER